MKTNRDRSSRIDTMYLILGVVMSTILIIDGCYVNSKVNLEVLRQFILNEINYIWPECEQLQSAADELGVVSMYHSYAKAHTVAMAFDTEHEPMYHQGNMDTLLEELVPANIDQCSTWLRNYIMQQAYVNGVYLVNHDFVTAEEMLTELAKNAESYNNKNRSNLLYVLLDYWTPTFVVTLFAWLLFTLYQIFSIRRLHKSMLPAQET